MAPMAWMRGWLAARSAGGRRGRKDRLAAPEALEPRRALSASRGNQPAWINVGAAADGATIAPALANLPQGTPGPRGFTPAEIRRAYGIDTLSFGDVPADGRGTTIAIVTAYDSPNVAADLATFNATFGLPEPPSFRKVNQNGGPRLPTVNPAWATETCIDVQWAHAIAPGAAILVVEASSNSDADLMAAVSYARSVPGVVSVSMSWGRIEYAGERAHDGLFTTPAGQPGVSFFAASGDYGAPGIYPAASRNVVAVGGTSLTLDAAGTAVERGWAKSGGGVSTQQPRPAWQAGVIPATAQRRAFPDVALVSDPATGLAVVDSRAGGQASPWKVYGGTSIAAPQWAALAALVAQGRALAGAAPLDGATQLLPALYALPDEAFRDVTSGTSTGSPRYAATAGWDFVTGLGSPVAATLVSALVAWNGAAAVAAPQAPAGFAATAISSSEVRLDWRASAGADGYRLWEITGGKATLVGTFGPGVTSATIPGLAPGSSHSWRLDAFNPGGSASATADATLAGGVAAPAGVVVKVLSRTAVQVSWRGVPGATAYSVYMLDGTTLSRVGGSQSRVTTIRVGGLTPGATLLFAVRAEDASTSNTSGWVRVRLPG